MSTRIHNNLKWGVLKALYDLYSMGKTAARIQDDPYCRYLIEDAELIEPKLASKKVILAKNAFYGFFERAYKERYGYYLAFLRENGLESDARRGYNEEDIRTLMFIAKNKKQIVARLTTRRSFSSEFFKGTSSKYLESKPSLEKAVCHMLNITSFPDMDAKENMWRFTVDCTSPQAVVLCENLNFLKMFWIAEQHNIKLWYVGGNNIKVLEQIDKREFDYPFYYSGDWDYAGLAIYSRIKEKLRVQGKDILLLLPDNLNSRLSVDSLHHNSKWDYGKDLSGLDRSAFSTNQLILIEDLINRGQWIEEESNDLMKMLEGFL
ncbi:Wadjet anti-phage system protein JetD domain-containing protein [uncultured Pedobacter sp.]|uniref:Wadjet anti-phage system protein JetD domain-containing protein n=1 Tax=uncultured Pedobacter sp. TaxID=246139 RepID=UPI0025F11F8F|nr:Wadjet anti-phage system protein JetD domain-containing protein [uncultured Pedobacter sp.]